jgi:hypothetical protein
MKRFSLGLASLLLLAVLLSGCANRPSWQMAEDTGQGLKVELPAVVLQIDETGSVANELLGPMSLIPPALNSLFSAELVGKFTAANIQHLQIDKHSRGLAIWLNGQPMFGSSRYEGADLGEALDVIAILSGETVDDPESGLTQAKSLLPFLDSLGVGLILEFPTQSGAAAMPYADTADFVVTSEEELAAIETTAQEERVTVVPITVAEDGFVTSENFILSMILGMLPADIEAKVPESMLETVAETGITQIAIKTRSSGLTIGINGSDLPLLLWNNGELDNLVALLKDEAAFNALLPDQDMESMTPIFDTLIPVLTSANFDLVLNFPSLN